MVDPSAYKQKQEQKIEAATPGERKELLTQLEKPWHQSKKFIGFLIMEMLLFTLLFVFIYTTKIAKTTEMTWQECVVAISMVFTMGFIALAFNLKQAALDQYLRGMALVGRVYPSSPTPSTPTKQKAS